jgi:outer membrane immunogenic protein
MKRLWLTAAALLAFGVSQASAADWPTKDAPIPAPVWSWTGFYVGANIGAGWGTTESTLSSISAPGLGVAAISLPIAQNSRSGFLGGGQIGYNRQFGWAVFGVEGDFSGLGVTGTAPCLIVLSCTADSHWLATVSGRIGGIVADKTLIYVKGGAAWLNTTHSLGVGAIGGLGGGGGVAGITGTSADSTMVGALLGLGAEYAFSPNWSAFIEYDYMDFQNGSISLPLTVPGGPTVNANVNLVNKLSIAKVGVNYKFW